MVKEVTIGNHTYYVKEDGIIQSVKAPAEENGLGHALWNIGKNIDEVKKGS